MCSLKRKLEEGLRVFYNILDNSSEWSMFQSSKKHQPWSLSVGPDHQAYCQYGHNKIYVKSISTGSQFNLITFVFFFLINSVLVAKWVVLLSQLKVSSLLQGPSLQRNLKEEATV